jgi:hypothetical protein
MSSKLAEQLAEKYDACADWRPAIDEALELVCKAVENVRAAMPGTDYGGTHMNEAKIILPLSRHPRNGRKIVDVGGRDVATCSRTQPPAEAFARAHFFILAVNSHDDLLAACKEAAEQGQHADVCGWWNIPVAERMTDSPESIARQEEACNCFLSTLRATIAKAEGR